MAQWNVPRLSLIYVNHYWMGQPNVGATPCDLTVDVLLHAMWAIGLNNDLLLFASNSVYDGDQIIVHRLLASLSSVEPMGSTVGAG